MGKSVKFYTSLLSLTIIFAVSIIANNTVNATDKNPKLHPPYEEDTYLEYCAFDGEYTCVSWGGAAIQCDWNGDGCTGPF